MTRDELAYILRAASQITGDPNVVIVGSQAILGTFDEDDLPDRVTLSVEADVAFWDDTADRKADQVDGAIGESSRFHETFGYYAQGVSITTSILPDGWRERLVRFENHSTAPGRGWCLDAHDLALAKLAAGREKDHEFVRALIEVDLLDCAVLLERAVTLPVGAVVRRRIETFVGAFLKR